MLYLPFIVFVDDFTLNRKPLGDENASSILHAVFKCTVPHTSLSTLLLLMLHAILAMYAGIFLFTPVAGKYQ